MSAPVVVSNVPARVSSVPDDFPLITVVENNRAMLSAKLPHGYTLEGMLVELYFAAQKQPDLLNVHPHDLVPALVEALDTGGTIGKDVYLLTFKNNKKPTPDVVVALNYQFKAELVVRAGGARAIDTHPVYSKEPFDLVLGSHPSVRHQPLSPSRRGQLIGAYAVAQLGHGVVKVQWCDQEYIETIRARSRAWSPKAGVAQCPDWYSCKTAVHRLVKLLPKNPKLTRILGKIHQEDELEFGGDPDEIARVDVPAAAHAPASTAGSPAVHGADFDGPEIPDEEPVPAPAPKPIEVGLDEALGMTVRGRALGEHRNTGLRAIAEWATQKCDEEGDDTGYARLVGACHAIIRAREKGELQEPAKKGSQPAPSADGGLPF